MNTYESPTLKILAQLRRDAGLTQEQVRVYFNRKNKDSVSQWENGKTRPKEGLRPKFIGYLLDMLGLRRQPEDFFDIWQKVMVGLWKWEDLTEDEIKKSLPSYSKRMKRNPVSGKLELIDLNNIPYTAPYLVPLRADHKLIGRDSLLEEIEKVLVNKRVSTLALFGLPGVGKTSSVIELANRIKILQLYNEGILWAGLQPNLNIANILQVWSIALGIQDKLASASEDQVPEIIRGEIGFRRLLIIIDNVWDIHSALQLKLGGPNCSHIITTRSPEIALRFANNRIYHIQELDNQQSLSLLQELAPKEVFRESEQTNINKLVDMLDGLPLGLVLVGNYLRVHGHNKQQRRIAAAIDKLLEIENRLKLSEPRLNTSISLASAISLSVEELDETTRNVFNSLSIFPPKPNSFSENAALNILKTQARSLDKLTDMGLLEIAGNERYTLHQVLNDFARLEEQDNSLFQQMLRYYAIYVEQNNNDYEILLKEINNIIEALQVGLDNSEMADLTQLTDPFYQFLEVQGLYRLGESALKHAEKEARRVNDRSVLTRCLFQLGRLSEKHGAYEDSKVYLEEGLMYAMEMQNIEMETQFLRVLGTIHIYLGDYGQAEKYFEQSLEQLSGQDNNELECDVLTNLGGLRIHKNDLDSAEACCKRALSLARELSWQPRESALLQNLGAIAERRNDLNKAEKYFVEGLTIAERIGGAERLCHLFANLGEILTKQDRLDEAEAYLKKGVEIGKDLPPAEIYSYLLVNYGTLQSKEGCIEEAEKYFVEGLDIAKELDFPWLISSNLLSFGDHYEHHNENDKAMSNYQEALELAQEVEIDELINLANRKISSLQASC